MFLKNCKLPSWFNWRSNRCHQWWSIRHLSDGEMRWYKPEGMNTGIRVYNCVAKRLVPFIINNQYFVSWYTCGPTVYDSCHLGHASSYVKFDIIQRILRQHFGLNIVSAINITDVDDKIIKKSQQTGQHWLQMTRYYEAEFWSNLRRLNVIEPNIKVRISDHIPKIITFIENIIRKEQAYVAKDKSVYFDVKAYRSYGKLKNLNLEATEAPPANDAFKKSDMDFALWKSQKTPDEPAWPSPWGQGRPAWHIECSTLASMIFGHTLQIHAGGIDLRFPHHENEEAQSCVYHDCKQWVDYWLHTGHLSIKGQNEKMSKSLHNTISVDEMLNKYTADEFRMACVLSNYRSSMEYSDEMMSTAKNTLHKFQTFKDDSQAYLSGRKVALGLDDSVILQNLEFARTHIDNYICDDFNTAKSITVLLDQIAGIRRCINPIMCETDAMMDNLQTASSLNTVAAVYNYVQHILKMFGFVGISDDQQQQRQLDQKEQINVNNLIEDVLQMRKIIRDYAITSKNPDLFQICDDMRNRLRQHGIEVRDHKIKSSWTLTKKS